MYDCIGLLQLLYFLPNSKDFRAWSDTSNDSVEQIAEVMVEIYGKVLAD